MTTYFPDEVFSNILAYCGETYEEKRNRLWSYIKPNYEELMIEGFYIIKVTMKSIQKGATLIDGRWHVYSHYDYWENLPEKQYVTHFGNRFEYHIDNDDRLELLPNPLIVHSLNQDDQDGDWAYGRWQNHS